MRHYDMTTDLRPRTILRSLCFSLCTRSRERHAGKNVFCIHEQIVLPPSRCDRLMNHPAARSHSLLVCVGRGLIAALFARRFQLPSIHLPPDHIQAKLGQIAQVRDICAEKLSIDAQQQRKNPSSVMRQ